MTLRKVSVVLLALLLAAMAMVPMVNAIEGKINSATLQITTPDVTSNPENDPEIRALLKSASDLETLPVTVSGRMERDGTVSSRTVDEETQTFLENYVSPSASLIKTMKAKRYSDTQITDLLSKNGYGWDPKTGASWKGTAPTAEEQKIIDKIRGPDYTPFLAKTPVEQKATTAWNGRAGGATQSLANENTQYRH